VEYVINKQGGIREELGDYVSRISDSTVNSVLFGIRH
jgi:hypothetical protein